MPYLEIRGERGTGKTSAGIAYALKYGLAWVAPIEAIARIAKRKLDKSREKWLPTYTCWDFDYMLVLIQNLDVGIVVDEAQCMKKSKNRNWGRSIRTNLKRLARSMWVVAIFRDNQNER